MANGRRVHLAQQLIEHLLALLVLGALVDVVLFWRHWGFLPPPFVFDFNDTFMDWFNTAQYAHNPGAYSIWASVYAPLSFVFLNILGFDSCYHSSPFDARNCDSLGLTAIVALYLISAILAGVALYRRDKATAVPRIIAFSLGLPLIYALERGNLIMATFIAFVFGYGGIVRSRWVKAAGIATAINFKSYILFSIFGHLVHRDWRFLELAGLMTILLYLLTMAIMGAGTPFELAQNISDWLLHTSGLVLEQIYYSTSYAPLMFIDKAQLPVRTAIGSRAVEFILFIVPLVINISRAVGLCALIGAWLYPQVAERGRLTVIGLLISFVAQSPGGYADLFVTFMVFMERDRRAGPFVALFCAYLLSVPYDTMVGSFFKINGGAWLSGRVVQADFGITIGSLVRPGLLIVILWALSLDTIAQVARQIRVSRPLHSLLRPLVHAQPQSLTGN